MDAYEQILAAWREKEIENERITYHDTREIFDHDGVTGKHDIGAALEAWDVSQDLNPLKQYLRAQAVKTWQKKKS